VVVGIEVVVVGGIELVVVGIEVVVVGGIELVVVGLQLVVVMQSISAYEIVNNSRLKIRRKTIKNLKIFMDIT